MGKEIFNIGDLIKKSLKAQGHTVSWLAKQMAHDRSNLYKMLKNNHLHPDRIRQISKILKHDFFTDYSTDLQESNNENSNETPYFWTDWNNIYYILR